VARPMIIVLYGALRKGPITALNIIVGPELNILFGPETELKVIIGALQ